MDPSKKRQVGMTAVAGGLLLLSGSIPITFGEDSHAGLVVLSYKYSGDAAGVTVRNAAKTLKTGTVVAEVKIDGKSTLMLQRFVVSGGNKVFVKVAIPNRKTKITRMGIIVDDGAPF